MLRSTVTQCLLEMTRLSLTRDQKGGEGGGGERARRTAAIMLDWLEFDPPGVESNRPTMLTEEKKRGSVFPSLFFSLSLLPGTDRRKEPRPER